MLPAFTTPRFTRWQRLLPALTVALACLGLLEGCFLPAAQAQVAEVLQEPETKKPESQKRTVEQWQTEVQERLAKVNEAVEAAAKDETEPSRTVTREQKALTRLNLLLTQLVSESSKQQKLEEDREAVKKTYDELVQDGLPEDADLSFRRLDKVREDLESEQRRLRRSKEKEEGAQAALETAEQEFKQRSSARRRAQEKADDTTTTTNAKLWAKAWPTRSSRTKSPKRAWNYASRNLPTRKHREQRKSSEFGSSKRPKTA